MRILFAGTPDFAVPSLETLINTDHDIVAVYTQPDRPVGRGRKLTAGPVKQTALNAGIPVYQPESLRPEAEIQQLIAHDADLMVVVAYGMILSQKVLDIPHLGCINVHASLLPRWRGAAPIQRAIIAGDRETGVTIMKMALKLDAGDMILKKNCPITELDTASSLHDRLSGLGAEALGEVIQGYERGSVSGEVQDESLVTYAEKLVKAEAVIDWNQSAEFITRQVRGFNSWPVAQTIYNDKVLRIWQAEAIDCSDQNVPGTVKINDKKQFYVATGKGYLNLQEVQLPGGKRMSASAFLNAHNPQGVTLGS